jgi:hypothetical protein
MRLQPALIASAYKWGLARNTALSEQSAAVTVLT